MKKSNQPAQKKGGNQWVKEALAGSYQFNTAGGTKKGKKPGFSKGGSVTAQQDKMRKGSVPTHGSDGAC